MQKTLISVAVLVLTCSTASLAADTGLKAVGVTLGSMGNPFFATLAKGAEDKAKELGGGGVKVTVDSADYDLGKQTNQIDNFIAAKVDAVSYTHLDVYKRQRQAGCCLSRVDGPQQRGEVR